MNIENPLIFPPPTYGSLTISCPFEPVSLQSTPVRKTELKKAIRAQIQDGNYFLRGEVEIVITWYLHERARYEGVHSPDIDNILKPLIDALSGLEGLLINDCQVQSVKCSWIDWLQEDQKIEVEIKFQPDEWLRKRQLLWVEISDKLCMPLYTSLPIEIQKLMLAQWQRMFAFRTGIVGVTGSWQDGQTVMPVCAPFHRARLRGFEKVTLEKYLAKLENSSA